MEKRDCILKYSLFFFTCSLIYHSIQSKLNHSLNNKEFTLFYSHITKIRAKEEQLQLYSDAVGKLALNLNEKEQTILTFATENPKLFPLVDAGIALYYTNSALKKRITLATAILECDKERTDLFLNKKNNPWAIPQLFVLAFKSVLIRLGAYLLFKYKGWK